ncbi:intercellular adhesion molecule 3 isoform X2 [Monodelphis domestica]|uniref:Intercellular adhesion molecule 3 n=1 Tax=Monodelphis domestica TaxID=13616 RepID=A0A5F8GZJ4_MONDO|nr:intercellular adhesion molecule 3 isoform X2 [Monodelphis domestica]
MARPKTWPKASLNLLVFALMLSGAPGIIWIEPPDPVTAPGGNLLVNCSTNCDQPQYIGLETPLNKTQVANGTRWKEFLLRNVIKDTELLCFANCLGEDQMLNRTTVTVIQPPEHVELEPLDPWISVGQNFSLRCQVLGGRPRQNLTVALFRGSQELSRQSVSEQDPEKVAEVTVTAMASREDHKANFSCRAELKLHFGSQGLVLYQNSSTPVELHTFVLDQDSPRLTAPKLLEIGKETTVSCEIDKLFPVEDAQIYLSLGGRNLSPNITQGHDMLRATAIAKGERDGQWELTCNVTLGNQNREVHGNLTIYSFPLPNLVISQPIVTEGTLVNVTCEAPVGAKVFINGTLSSPGEIAQLSLTATEEYDGYWFTCQAVLELIGEKLWRNKSLQLQVLYGPRLEEVKCPGNWTWPEGTTQIMQCKASGNPVPSVACAREKDQKTLHLGVPLKVTTAHRGHYRCLATSSQGQREKRVTVTVLESQRDPVSIAVGVLLALGLATTAGAITIVFLRKHLQRGSYQPQTMHLKDLDANGAAGAGH